MKKRVPIKKWLNIVKNYYISLRYLIKNNMVGEPYMKEEEQVIVKKLNEIMMLAPTDYLLIYSARYCKGKSSKDIIEIFGFSKRTLYRIENEIEYYLENKLGEVI